MIAAIIKIVKLINNALALLKKIKFIIHTFSKSGTQLFFSFITYNNRAL